MIIVCTDRVNAYTNCGENEKQITDCFQRFLKGNIDKDRKTVRLALKFGRCMDDPKHEFSDYGAYRVGTANTCFIAYNGRYPTSRGTDELVVIAFKQDIDFTAADPLQDLIDRVSYYPESFSVSVHRTNRGFKDYWAILPQ